MHLTEKSLELYSQTLTLMMTIFFRSVPPVRNAQV